MAVLHQAVLFFLLILVGMYGRYKGIITKSVESGLSSLVVNIAYPAIILVGVMGSKERIDGSMALEAVVGAIAVMAMLIVAGFLLPWLLDFRKSQRSIVNLMTVFTNVGFMGLPMIKGIYGSDALIYMTIFIIVCNLLFFSYALRMIQQQKEPFSWRKLINAGMIACVLAIVVYITNVSVPAVLVDTLSMLGNMTAPLAMLLTGSFLMDVKVKEVLSNYRVLIFSLLKMIVLPVLVVVILNQFIHNTYILAVSLAVACTPSGNVLALLASLYNKEAYPTALHGVAITTIISVVTMPLVFWIVGL